MHNDVLNTKLVKGLVSNLDTVINDYHKVEKFARRMPGKDQRSTGKGWAGIFLRVADKSSKISTRIPDTMKLCEDALAVNIIVLHGQSFVPENTALWYPEDATIVHFPFIVPEGDLGMKFSDNGEIKRWKTGVPLVYQSGRLYEGWNYSEEKRILLHLVVDNKTFM